MTPRILAAAAVMLFCLAPVVSLGQSVVKVSYSDEWYDPNGTIGKSTTGDIHIAGNGRQRHDWILETGEVVSEITLPDIDQRIMINHTARTALRGRASDSLPMPGLESQPRSMLPAPNPGVLQRLGDTIRAAAAALIPGQSTEVDGFLVLQPESLGTRYRWGFPLEGERINQPRRQNSPAQQVERWVYVSEDRMVRVEVEQIVTAMPDDGGAPWLMRAKRPTDIRYVPDHGDLFTAPTDVQTSDWSR